MTERARADLAVHERQKIGVVTVGQLAEKGELGFGEAIHEIASWCHGFIEHPAAGLVETGLPIFVLSGSPRTRVAQRRVELGRHRRICALQAQDERPLRHPARASLPSVDPLNWS